MPQRVSSHLIGIVGYGHDVATPVSELNSCPTGSLQRLMNLSLWLCSTVLNSKNNYRHTFPPLIIQQFTTATKPPTLPTSHVFKFQLLPHSPALPCLARDKRGCQTVRPCIIRTTHVDVRGSRRPANEEASKGGRRPKPREYAGQPPRASSETHR